MREVKDYVDEAFQTLEESYEEDSEELQKKKGIFSKVMIEHIDKFYKSKISILRLLRYSPVSIFKDENFRKCDVIGIAALRMNSTVLREAVAPVADKVMHYFVGVFSIKRNKVTNYNRFELDNKIMYPNNINEYMDGIDTLVDQIVLHFYSCGNPDTKHFEYIKDRY